MLSFDVLFTLYNSFKLQQFLDGFTMKQILQVWTLYPKLRG